MMRGTAKNKTTAGGTAKHGQGSIQMDPKVGSIPMESEEVNMSEGPL
jgi:hypothetical protein